MPENPVALKGYGLGLTDDKKWVLLKMDAQGVASTTYAVPAVSFRGFIAEMIKFESAVQVDEALAPDSELHEEQEALSATESAMLLAKTVDLVRWESGGAILRATTTDGMAIHLALNPAHREFLLDALSSDLPK